jgi:GNAT superfamily N-acetyltransferase
LHPTPLRIEPVQARKDLDRFVKLPWKIYRGNPNWVPPLLHDVYTLLDRTKHPFHRHAEVEYFLARRGDEIVGRIAAIVNHAHVAFHEEKAGFFGFFESIDDPDVARALLATAEQWVQARGMELIRGPMSFSTNEECGLLIDAFDKPPVIMMTYNPPYYERLITGAGYVKAKDLLAHHAAGVAPPEVLIKRAARARAQGVVVRQMDLKRFDEEVAIVKEIYNTAWERNWGFVPMTDEEFAFLAKQLRPVADPHVLLIVEVNGKPAGFALGLPDFNVALKHMNGRLFPFGIFKALWYKRRIKLFRAITLGLKPEFRRQGIDVLLYLAFYEGGLAGGYTESEGSWILEDNWDMRRGMERFGYAHYKTYRIFDKPL